MRSTRAGVPTEEVLNLCRQLATLGTVMAEHPIAWHNALTALAGRYEGETSPYNYRQLCSVLIRLQHVTADKWPPQDENGRGSE